MPAPASSASSSSLGLRQVRRRLDTELGAWGVRRSLNPCVEPPHAAPMSDVDDHTNNDDANSDATKTMTPKTQDQDPPRD